MELKRPLGFIPGGEGSRDAVEKKMLVCSLAGLQIGASLNGVSWQYWCGAPYPNVPFA